LTLEPYLDLISIPDLRHFADACNRLGWFRLRRRLLDARIGTCRYVWSSERASAQFDSFAVEDRHHWIGLEVEEVLKTGLSWEEYARAMRA